MKKIVQVHNKRSASAPDAQAKIPTPAAPVKRYSLLLQEWTPENLDRPMTVGEVDISPENFDTLKRNSIKAGDYVYRGEPVPDKLLKIGLKAMQNAFPACELENATAANNALLELLAEHMELERHDSGVSAFTGTKAGPLCFGILQLVDMCRDRLNKAAGLS
jgi:hypothetical protein